MLKNSRSCFISVTLKSWSGRQLLAPTTQPSLIIQLNNFIHDRVKTKSYANSGITVSDLRYHGNDDNNCRSSRHTLTCKTKKKHVFDRA